MRDTFATHATPLRSSRSMLLELRLLRKLRSTVQIGVPTKATTRALTTVALDSTTDGRIMTAFSPTTGSYASYLTDSGKLEPGGLWLCIMNTNAEVSSFATCRAA